MRRLIKGMDNNVMLENFSPPYLIQSTVAVQFLTLLISSIIKTCNTASLSIFIIIIIKIGNHEEFTDVFLLISDITQ